LPNLFSLGSSSIVRGSLEIESNLLRVVSWSCLYCLFLSLISAQFDLAIFGDTFYHFFSPRWVFDIVCLSLYFSSLSCCLRTPVQSDNNVMPSLTPPLFSPYALFSEGPFVSISAHALARPSTCLFSPELADPAIKAQSPHLGSHLTHFGSFCCIIGFSLLPPVRPPCLDVGLISFSFFLFVFLRAAF